MGTPARKSYNPGRIGPPDRSGVPPRSVTKAASPAAAPAQSRPAAAQRPKPAAGGSSVKVKAEIWKDIRRETVSF